MRKLFLGISLLLLASCGDASQSDKAENKTLEQMLIVLDTNAPAETTDIKVIRAKTLLNNLAEFYHEPKDSIADLTSRCQGVLHDRGIDEKNLTILEEMNKLGKVENTPYREAVALFAVVRYRGI